MILGTKVKPKEPPVAPGLYPAICVGIFDLGDQESHYGDSKKTTWPRKLAFTFDLTTEMHKVDDKEQPLQLTTKFNIAFGNNSKLRPFLSDWVGKEMSKEEAMNFDTNTLLGSAVMLNVVHSEDGQYANIKSVVQPMKGYTIPGTATPLLTFDIDNWDDKTFEILPEWVQETIKKSLQYQKLHAPADKVDLNAVSQRLNQSEKEGLSTQSSIFSGASPNTLTSNSAASYQTTALSGNSDAEEAPPF